MRIEDLILVSVDDHVVEPPNLFEGRISAKYAQDAPRLIRKPSGIDVWLYEGMELANIGLNAVAGRPPQEYALDPTSFDEMRPGCWDIDVRVKDMSANGVLGSMCFPSFPQFCGQLFARTKDKDLALAVLQAYNDWHVEGWCGAYPDRFIPLGLVALWDPQVAADEVRRLAAMGCHAVSFPENPASLGFPSIHTEHWDPFFEACDELGTVICMHLGSSSNLPITSADAPMDVLITITPMNIVQAAADLVWSRTLKKYRNVKIALSEGGIGWIPYFLERIDYVYEHHRFWTEQDLGGRLPSEIFREQIITCFIDDPVGVSLRERIGINQITWECDYPHADATWPRSPEEFLAQMNGVSDGDINKISHENAMRLFRYDPFAVRSRNDCTVGALRGEVAGWDVGNKSIGLSGQAHAVGDLVEVMEVTRVTS